MNRLFFPYFTTLAIMFSSQVGFYAFALAEEYHTFTNKKGQKIEAQLMSITPDKKRAYIRKKGSREVPVEIVTLSLDDQQYLKNWLRDNPIKLEFNLDVSFNKHQLGTDRQPVPNYNVTWATNNTNMEIKVQNKSREKLTGATIEYYIIIEQGINVNPYREGSSSRKEYGVDGWWYHNERSSKGMRGKRKMGRLPILIKHGKSKMVDLPFNYSEKIISETFPLREIEGDSQSSVKDGILGVIVKITAENGSLIGVYRSNDHKLFQRDWDIIAQMPPGDPLGHPSEDGMRKPRN